MTSAAQLAEVAALLADQTRAAFCLALLDGRAWTAGELARHAGVAPSTATEHLHRLTAAGFLVEHRQGRHRYVALAGPAIATLIEDLSAHLAPAPPGRTLKAATVSAALARGRTCYDHFAGRLGVAVLDALTDAGYLKEGVLTEVGHEWFVGTLGVAPRGPRPLVRLCLDWTERRPHLAGAAGAHLCHHAFEQGWVKRIGTSRAVRVTPAGAAALHGLLGVRLE
jgi:DNA-binding transcriptional ArsR family regulator